MTAAVGGDLEVEIAPENRYAFTGLAEDLLEGPQAVDPAQLELGVELLLDAADWAGRRGDPRGARDLRVPRMAGLVRPAPGPEPAHPVAAVPARGHPVA